MKKDNSLVPTNGTKALSFIDEKLSQIRTAWRDKQLIQRVKRLISVDPSSACQRLFNAAIHDLKEKILVAGIDLAKEAAKNYKLPPIEKDEDIFEYSTFNTLDLCYRMGILSRPDWRRLHRCYEIRRDLEHEDNEYEAVIQDCIYIFTSTVEAVLSKDPVHLLKITDVKQIVETPTPIVVGEEFLENFESAPIIRQKEILLFLISTAMDLKQPEIIREKCLSLCSIIKDRANLTAIIDIANYLEQRQGHKPLDKMIIQIGHLSGAVAYFKKSKLKDYYVNLYRKFQAVGCKWDNYREHEPLLEDFEDVGGLDYCPSDLIEKYVKWLILCYIGERGGYGMWGSNRRVFFSDTASPIISRIIKKSSQKDLKVLIEKLRKDKDIEYAISDKYVLRRFENLIDIASGKDI